MLHLLELENFRQHRSFTVDFSAGLNVLSGDNGAGKSGVLKAIMYCLFGSAATASKKENLTTWGSSERMECRLTLSIGSKSIIITRGLEKSTIYEGESLLASGHTPCTKWIEQELGLDAKTFKHLMYAPQGETQALLKIGAADLQRKIELITKVDGIDRIIKMVGEDLSVLSGKLSVLPPAEDINALEAQAKILERVVEDLTKSIEEKATMHSKNNESLAERRRKLKEIAHHIEMLKSHRTKQDTLRESLLGVTVDLSKLEQTTPDISSKQLNGEIEAIRSDINEKTKALNKSKDNEKFINRLHEQHTADIDACLDWEAKEVKLLQREQLVADLVSLEGAVAQDKTELEAALGFNTHCPTCGSEYDECATDFHNSRLNELKKNLAFSEQAFAKAKENLVTFDKVTQGKHMGLQPYHAHAAKLQEQAEQSLQALRKVNNDFPVLPEDEIKYLVDSIQNETTVLEQKSLQLAPTQRWEREYESLLQHKQRLNTELGNLGEVVEEYSIEELEEMEQDVAMFQQQVQKEYDALIEARYNLKENKGHSQACGEKLAQAVKAEAIRLQAEHEQAERKELQNYLRNNRARLMNGTWDTITNLTGAYTSDITEGLLSGLSRDESGEFTITEGGHTVPVSELSGGRQSIVGLALRMALGQTFFGDHGFVLLDECSADLTDANAAAVAGFLSGLDTQVIMVTHRQGDSLNATNVIVL